MFEDLRVPPTRVQKLCLRGLLRHRETASDLQSLRKLAESLERHFFYLLNWKFLSKGSGQLSKAQEGCTWLSHTSEGLLEASKSHFWFKLKTTSVFWGLYTNSLGLQMSPGHIGRLVESFIFQQYLLRAICIHWVSRHKGSGNIFFEDTEGQPELAN